MSKSESKMTKEELQRLNVLEQQHGDRALAKLILQKEQIENRIQDKKAQAEEEERKRDTRRKIVLGGALFEAARLDQKYADVLDDLYKYILQQGRSSDRASFRGWKPAQEGALPPTPPAPAPDTAEKASG
jgi:hypothetical protein